MKIFWQGKERNVLEQSVCDDGTAKYLAELDYGLRAWVPERFMKSEPFQRNTLRPSIVVCDNFYADPHAVRDFALAQEFQSDLRYFKGSRSSNRYLWPFLKEELETLLRLEITDWLDQSANGVFQVTDSSDPIVWHADHQDYAAAVYLTPDAPPSAGTSFWRDKNYKCRRPPTHPLESDKFSDGRASSVMNEMFSSDNVISPNSWELVDSVGSVFNRLVVWDAQMIHSATSYADFDDVNRRLVQLFFFNVRHK